MIEIYGFSEATLFQEILDNWYREFYTGIGQKEPKAGVSVNDYSGTINGGNIKATVL